MTKNNIIIYVWLLSIFLIFSANCAGKQEQQQNFKEQEKRLGAIYSQQKQLYTKIERLENSLLILQDQLEVLKLRKKQKKISKRELPPPPRKSRKRVNPAEYSRKLTKDAYQLALDLYQNGKYDKALVAFEQFVRNNPQSELADNAIYWMGETFYAQKEYALALQEFQRVINRYPQGNKVPDAMLKIGFSYHRLGNKNKSIAAMQKVIEKYQGTRAYGIAKDFVSKNEAKSNLTTSKESG